MAVISSVLAIIGLIILTVAGFALIGAGSTASALGLGEGLTSALTGIGSLIASYWQIFAALFTIGLIAIVARGSRSNGSTVDTAIGAAEGVKRAMTDGGDPVTNPNPDSNPSPSPSPSEPADIQDTTNPSDRSDSSGSSRNNRNNRGSAGYRPRGDEETARGNSPRNRSNINNNNASDNMGLRDRAGQYANKATGLFENDEEIEKKELSDMGQLAERIQKEMGDLEKEEEVDQNLLQDVKTISAHLRQLMEDEGEMKKLLAEGITVENYDQTLPRVQELATKIKEEGNEVSNDFEQLKNDINSQTSGEKQIEMDEQNIKELAQAVSSEHDRHQEIISKAEQVLSQGLLSDHPYSNQ